MSGGLTEKERDLIREKIQEKYVGVAAATAGCFRYPTGAAGIRQQEYPEELWRDFPPDLLESFCGVGNPFSLGPVRPGEAVLDIGCGAGFDALVAARLVGPQGRVVGLDLTKAMLEKARHHQALLGLKNVFFQEGEAETLPFPDQEFELIISNGVFNLALNKEKAVQEAFRVLKPGGRLMLADMVLVAALPPERNKKVENWFQ
jgi:SAM-dependent methyltransferase